MIRLYDVISSFRDKATNMLNVSVGDLLGKEVSIDNVISGFGPFGIASIPEESTADSACEVLVSEQANESYAIGFRSSKLLTEIGKLVPGELLLFNAFGCKIALKKSGSITLMTKLDDGSINQFTIGKAGLQWLCPWGSINFDKDGFRVRHGNASFILGQIGGISVPGFSVDNYCSISCDSITLNGKCNLGESASGIYAPCAFVITPTVAGAPVVPPIGGTATSSVYVATGI